MKLYCNKCSVELLWKTTIGLTIYYCCPMCSTDIRVEGYLIEMLTAENKKLMAELEEHETKL